MVTTGNDMLKRPAATFRSASRSAGTVATVGGAGVGAGAVLGSAVMAGTFTSTAAFTAGAAVAVGVSVATCVAICRQHKSRRETMLCEGIPVLGAQQHEQRFAFGDRTACISIYL